MFITQPQIMTVKVEDTTRSQVIAAAGMQKGLLSVEGHFYFAPELVNMENLVITRRTYVCAYKGVAYWLDLRAESGECLPDVAWMYWDVKPDYAQIANYIAFPSSGHPAIKVHIESNTAL